MNRAMNISVFSLVLLIAFLITGCSGKRQVSYHEKSRDELSCIAVIPSQTPVNWNDSISYEQARELEKGAALVDAVLKERLAGSKFFRFVEEDQLDHAMKRKGKERLASLRSVAKTISCNAILSVTVNRYRQRVGGSYSVDVAASAALELELISTFNGRRLCNESFDETQEPLLSNLLSMKKASRRGFKWVKVEELTRNGINELLTKCPYTVLTP